MKIMKKQMTRIAAVLMALALCFTCLSAEAQAASKVRLNKTRVTLYTNGSATLKVSGTSKKVKFTSNRKSVATVTSKGKVTAKKPGTAVITAKTGSKKLTCKVTVKKENPKLSKTRTTLYAGKSTTLKVSGTSRKPVFTSSRKSVATVSSSGKVTGKKPGTAVISAKVGSKRLTCKVTVKKAVPTKSVSIYWNGEKPVRAEGASGNKVEWKSSNPSVVSVKSNKTAKAVLTGKKVGKTTVTVKCNGKTVKKYNITVKMKKGPLTKREKLIFDAAVSKYEDCIKWNTMTTDADLKAMGVTREEWDNRSRWNTHKKAIATARKYLPGREIHIKDVNSAEEKWKNVHKLQKKGVRYIDDEGGSMAHYHGKREKHSLAWIE